MPNHTCNVLVLLGRRHTYLHGNQRCVHKSGTEYWSRGTHSMPPLTSCGCSCVIMVSNSSCFLLKLNRHYPREQARDQLHSGRVRVQLYNRDGTPCNSSIPNSKLDTSTHTHTTSSPSLLLSLLKSMFVVLLPQRTFFLLYSRSLFSIYSCREATVSHSMWANTEVENSSVKRSRGRWSIKQKEEKRKRKIANQNCTKHTAPCCIITPQNHLYNIMTPRGILFRETLTPHNIFV